MCDGLKQKVCTVHQTHKMMPDDDVTHTVRTSSKMRYSAAGGHPTKHPSPTRSRPPCPVSLRLFHVSFTPSDTTVRPGWAKTEEHRSLFKGTHERVNLHDIELVNAFTDVTVFSLKEQQPSTIAAKTEMVPTLQFQLSSLSALPPGARTRHRSVEGDAKQNAWRHYDQVTIPQKLYFSARPRSRKTRVGQVKPG